MTQLQALSILKTGANAFLTGEPGSGKTHTINEYISYLQDSDIAPSITASTGIAATHVGGMTIHSWSGIGIKSKLDRYELDKLASSEYLAKRIGKAKVLIIDEVSMLSPDTLGAVDMVCREVRQSSEPFGGLQIIFVGDFFQLPPVIRLDQARDDINQDSFFEDGPPQFAYDSIAWKNAKPIVCYLTEQHRQDDDTFLEVLSAIRSNAFSQVHLEHIEKRKITRDTMPENKTKLYSHNADVDRVNDTQLATLKDAPQTFLMDCQGKDTVVAALMKGCLSPATLVLKVGAEVMFTKNNSKEGYVNGTLGTVVSFESGSNLPIVKTRSGRSIRVEAMDWTVEENGKVRGRITQLPLRLAWAITVHKSQGMSLDEAIMDLSDVFEYGQGYVALSRVRRLSGLHILGWNRRTFEVHPNVLEKDTDFRALSKEAETAFSKIPAADLTKMHHNFIHACGGQIIKEGSVRKKNRQSLTTYEKTLALWNEGKDIKDIAKIRKLTAQTIFDHIEKLAKENKITKRELERLLPQKLKKEMGHIHATFKRLDTDKLTPVFETLGGKYSYDDLRISRMLL